MGRWRRAARVARFYPGLAGLTGPGDPLQRAKLNILDELIDVARKEEGIREHEYTPEGLYKAVLLTTGNPDLAGTCRAAAQLAEMRDKDR